MINWLLNLWDDLKSEVGIIALFLILIAGLIWWCFAYENHKEKIVMPEGFSAWVKQTGNSNDLSYAEWRALLRATERHDQIIIVH
jgi:hypothetical protein